MLPQKMAMTCILDCIEQCFTSPPTQYRLYGRWFLQVKRPNQQYQSTEGTNSTQTNQTYNQQTWTQNTTSPLVYNNMGWLRDGSHRGQGCQAWTVMGPPLRYPRWPAQPWRLDWYMKCVNQMMKRPGSQSVVCSVH